MQRSMLLVSFVVLAATACGGDDDDDDTMDTSQDATQDGAGTPTAQVVDCADVTPDHTITIDNTMFQMGTKTVAAGDVVQWTNTDSIPHTVTSGTPSQAGTGSLFDSGNLANGASYCLQFDGVGAADYFCEIHTGMTGTITVQ